MQRLGCSFVYVMFCWGSWSDWVGVCMAESFVNIVARVSSQMFGGSQLSQNAEWLGATIHFATDGFIGAQKLKAIPEILRPVAQYFIPELRRIRGHHATAQRIIVPILRQRAGLMEKPSDFLQWMSDSAIGPEKEESFIASIQLKLSFAAIHTSAAAPTQLLYDLCAMPHYIEPLREEVRTILAEQGSLTKRSLSQMKKLDSFMKESQRFNPLLLSTYPDWSLEDIADSLIVTFERLVTKDYALSDGFVIPKGTTIGVPTQAISMNPDIYEDPEVFDGFRFIKLRENPEHDDSKMQYASSNLTNMAFGYGRHACPGRFFASCEIKMIMAYLLLHYEFKFPEGQIFRPPSLTFETQYLPDHKCTIMLKRRASPLWRSRRHCSPWLHLSFVAFNFMESIKYPSTTGRRLRPATLSINEISNVTTGMPASHVTRIAFERLTAVMCVCEAIERSIASWVSQCQQVAEASSRVKRNFRLLNWPIVKASNILHHSSCISIRKAPKHAMLSWLKLSAVLFCIWLSSVDRLCSMIQCTTFSNIAINFWQITTSSITKLEEPLQDGQSSNRLQSLTARFPQHNTRSIVSKPTRLVFISSTSSSRTAMFIQWHGNDVPELEEGKVMLGLLFEHAVLFLFCVVLLSRFDIRL